MNNAMNGMRRVFFMDSMHQNKNDQGARRGEMVPNYGEDSSCDNPLDLRWRMDGDQKKRGLEECWAHCLVMEDAVVDCTLGEEGNSGVGF